MRVQQPRTRAPRAALAPRLVGKFPSHDGRLVEITSDERFSIILECILSRGVNFAHFMRPTTWGTHDNSRVCIEPVVVGGVGELLDVHIHTAIVCPVIRPVRNRLFRILGNMYIAVGLNSQCDDETEIVSLGGSHDRV